MFIKAHPVACGGDGRQCRCGEWTRRMHAGGFAGGMIGVWTVAAPSNLTCDGMRTGVSDLTIMTGAGRWGDTDRPSDQALSGGAEPVRLDLARPDSHAMLGWCEFAPWNMAGGVVAVGMQGMCGVQ
mmetsp:Transcript_85172/g.168986  ORF Transcript_85172/g.168986 Transcript_85172/m.168986 type:complete len:126 (+) Transcript_85172:401-778(+)